MSTLAQASRDIRLDDRSRYLRELVIQALEGGGRGHVGSTLSLIEIFRVLYDDILRVRPHEPDWPERDRCILSKGHGCLALYALLADKGFFAVDELRRQCRPEAMLGGHPERGHIPGVEASTGALGHGLSIGVGMALAIRMKRQEARVYVVTGDGELDEGAIWEGAMSAAKHGLGILTVLVDHNKLQSYGPVDEVLALEPLADKWLSFGFHVQEVNGHDITDLHRGLHAAAIVTERPSVIICHTVKGKGFDMAEDNPSWHHKTKIGAEDVALMRAALGRHQCDR